MSLERHRKQRNLAHALVLAWPLVSCGVDAPEHYTVDISTLVDDAAIDATTICASLPNAFSPFRYVTEHELSAANGVVVRTVFRDTVSVEVKTGIANDLVVAAGSISRPELIDGDDLSLGANLSGDTRIVVRVASAETCR